jgi:hypothetical protein
MDLCLRDGERMKFARPRGSTNPITRRTVPPDDVIGEIINSNQAFIDDVNTLQLPTFPTDRPNAARAAKLATNYCTPYNVFGKADEKWKAMNPSKCFNGSYLSQIPSTWANQKLGLATSTHLANHINNSLAKLTFCGGSSTQSDESDIKLDNDDCWRFFDGLMEEQHARREEDSYHLPGTREPLFFGSYVVTEELLRR